jgi:hypothetical protein
VNALTPEQLKRFFERLSKRYDQPAKLYVFGGSALLLIGSRRNTGDFDFTVNDNNTDFRHAIEETATELGIDAEESVPAEFMPLPQGADARHTLIARVGQLSIFIFDLYSIAVMKIDRAFETDIEDVRYLLKNDFINLADLEHHIIDVASRYDEPLNLRRNFEEMKRGL